MERERERQEKESEKISRDLLKVDLRLIRETKKVIFSYSRFKQFVCVRCNVQ